jgi:hypothetical protein
MDEERIVDPVSQVELVVPVHATSEQVIRREALRRDGQLREIRFFPDWGHASGLWESSGDVQVLEPEDLRLSADLARAIEHWSQLWVNEFTPNMAWTSADLAESWRLEGDRLAARISAEVWRFAEVKASHRTY